MLDSRTLENVPKIADAIAESWLQAAQEGLCNVPIPEALNGDDRINRLSQRVERVLFTLIGGLARI